MSNAWKCACATLRHMRWNTYTHKLDAPTAGYYNEEYDCAAKKFFDGLIPNRSVGGWVDECRNFTCSAMNIFKAECTRKKPEEWCAMCVVRERVTSACSFPQGDGNLTLCPFFRPRTVEEWRRLVIDLKLPFLTSKGTLRPEAKAAKRHFKLNDADFDVLVKKLLADRAEAKAAAEFARASVEAGLAKSSAAPAPSGNTSGKHQHERN